MNKSRVASLFLYSYTYTISVSLSLKIYIERAMYVYNDIGLAKMYLMDVYYTKYSRLK